MSRRIGEVVLVAIAIILVLIGVLSGEWLALQDAESSNSLKIGLRAVTACSDSTCRSESLKFLPVSAAFSMSGNVAFFGGLIAAALAALAAGLALANKQVAGPISPARMAAAMFVVTMIASVVFMAAKPEELSDLRIGMAGPLTMAGGFFGTVGSIMLALNRGGEARSSAQQRLPSAPVAQGMAPACPQCTGPLQWMPTHDRWYCPTCRAYPAA